MKKPEAIQTIIQTRDFCGNEAEALKDWEAENGAQIARLYNGFYCFFCFHGLFIGLYAI